MKFILEKFKDGIEDVEVFNALYSIKHASFKIPYKIISLNELINSDIDLSDYTPIGRIPFVQSWLKKYFNISYMPSIEVPKCLRTEKYLGRKYSIITREEVPKDGYWFLKDAEKLKNFTYLGDLKDIDKSILTSNLFVKASYIDIVSEYRVFVDNLDIKAIQYYDGDCLKFPDVNIIKEMVCRYSFEENRPKSYTMDIAILRDNKTVILEVHPVSSVGTYGYDAFNLLYMYEDAVNWYKKVGVDKKWMNLLI